MIRMEVIGRLGKDAERKAISGHFYTGFSVALSENVKGEKKTIWVDVLKADREGSLTPHLRKGMKVYVTGRPQMSAYYSEKYREAKCDLTIWADMIEFCAKPDSNRAETQSGNPASPDPAQQEGDVDSADCGFNDDLPF